MPTFSPPTFNVRVDAREGAGPTERVNFSRGRSVRIVGGVASTYPGEGFLTGADIDAADAGSGYDGKAVFLGGHVWTVTAGEETILNAAGYTTT